MSQVHNGAYSMIGVYQPHGDGELIAGYIDTLSVALEGGDFNGRQVDICGAITFLLLLLLTGRAAKPQVHLGS